MICRDARERLSDLLDGLLAGPERREMELHLATCAECARERDGLRQTVALLHRVEPAHAPVGFVDRVMARAAPEPWLRRALRAAFVPLGTKIPAQAAAAALLTIGTVYVFQRTPELRQAALTEVPGGWREIAGTGSAATPPASRSTPTEPTALDSAGIGRRSSPAASPASPELPEGRLARPPGAPLEAAKHAAGPRPAGPDRLTAAPIAPPQSEPRPGRADDPPADPSVAAAPATSAETPAGSAPAMAARSKESAVGGQAGPERAPESSKPAREIAPGPLPALVAPRGETGAAGSGADSSTHRQPAEVRERGGTRPPPAAFGPLPQEREPAQTAARMLSPADVTIRLVARDRAALSASLADLLARAGGAEASRRPDGSDLVIEVVVPRAAYLEFARGVARLGQNADVPEAPALPPSVRVLIRIAP